MKKTIFSQEPRHVEARQKYGVNLGFVSAGANITQVVEGINSSIIMLILFYSHVGKYGIIAVAAASVVAIALAYTVQSVIRGAFSTYSRLKNDDTADSFQMAEIRFSLFAGIVSALIALCLTFGSSYLMSKAVNATERHSMVDINSSYDAKIESEKSFWIKSLESERSDYEKTVSNIENKFDAKAKTAKTEVEKAYVLSQRQKVLDKNKAKFDAKAKDIEEQKNKAVQVILDAKDAATSAAETENGTNETIENSANNIAWWSFFIVSVVLVSASVVFVYKKAEYMEKCGIKIIREQKKPEHYHFWVIFWTTFRRTTLNWGKNIMIDINNAWGVDVKDIDGVAIPNSSKPKKANMEKIVFTAPAVLEHDKTVEVVHPKVETVKTEPTESNVFEFDLKPKPIVQQQNSDRLELFKNYVYKNMGGVTVNGSVEKMLNSYRESEKGRLQIAARKQGVHTYLKRFYDYAATGKEPIKVRKQAETVLANGLWLIENGFSVECSDDTGKLQIIINEKKK